MSNEHQTSPTAVLFIHIQNIGWWIVNEKLLKELENWCPVTITLLFLTSRKVIIQRDGFCHSVQYVNNLYYGMLNGGGKERKQKKRYICRKNPVKSITYDFWCFRLFFFLSFFVAVIIAVWFLLLLLLLFISLSKHLTFHSV